jgi:hypothetical protein
VHQIEGPALPPEIEMDTVVIAFQQGASAESIVEHYDSLDLADVYAVISFYLRHRPEVDEYMRIRDDEAATIRAENERRFPSKALRDKLLARRAENQ